MMNRVYTEGILGERADIHEREQETGGQRDASRQALRGGGGAREREFSGGSGEEGLRGGAERRRLLFHVNTM